LTRTPSVCLSRSSATIIEAAGACVGAADGRRGHSPSRIRTRENKGAVPIGARRQNVNVMSNQHSRDAEAVHPLEEIFHPRGIAVVGVSASAGGFGGFGGNMFLTAIKGHGYAGGLYAVNPKATEINGQPCYPDLRSIPGPVDYVISSVPARAVLGLIDDAQAKGVKVIHFFTAGFRETGDESRA
jgi:predicted CoA-binding protein